MKNIKKNNIKQIGKVVLGGFIILLTIGGCVNSDKQEYGEMVTEILETSDKPEHPIIMYRRGNKTYDGVNISAIVKKYFPIGATRKEVVEILKQQKIDDYHFVSYDYEQGKQQKRNKLKNFRDIDKTQHFVSGFSEIIVSIDIKIEGDSIDNVPYIGSMPYNIPKYKIGILIKFIDDKMIEVSGNYRYNGDYKL